MVVVAVPGKWSAVVAGCDDNLVLGLVVARNLFVVVMVEVVGITWGIVSVSGNGGCGPSDRGSGSTWEIVLIVVVVKVVSEKIIFLLLTTHIFNLLSKEMMNPQIYLRANLVF